MNTIFHRCPHYSVRSVHLRPVLENFLDILAARQHLTVVAYSKCRSRHRARMIPRSRCRSPSTPLPRRAPRPGRRPRPTAREPTSTRRVFGPPHAQACWLRVCHRTRSTQHSYQVYQHVQKLASCVGSAPVARRGAPAAAAPSARSASNVHNSPTQSTPGLSAQFLRTRHRRLRRGSSSYAAGFSGIR